MFEAQEKSSATSFTVYLFPLLCLTSFTSSLPFYITNSFMPYPSLLLSLLPYLPSSSLSPSPSQTSEMSSPSRGRKILNSMKKSFRSLRQRKRDSSRKVSQLDSATINTVKLASFPGHVSLFPRPC